MQKQMAQAEKAMALRLQEERIRTMMQKEKDAKQMRFEWRQQNERSYDRQIEEGRIKAEADKQQIRSGPTTIGALGSHYEIQLAKLRAAEQRIDNRGAAVADVINAKRPKDLAAENRVHEDHGFIDDKKIS